jgi:membrane fusion protein, multidrug efflux system
MDGRGVDACPTGALCRPLALALALALTACGASEEKGGPGGMRGGGQVGFVVTKVQAVPIESSLSGRVTAFQTAEVRPQVSGVIRRRLFTEGGYVRQGQALYQIDPSLYRAAVDQAAANLAAASAAAEAARTRAERYRPLAEAEAISKQEYTDAAAQARQARASVAQNNAALNTARINLRYTTVPAPISGRIGRSLITEGALVTGNQADPLAVISTLDPVYVDIQQSSADLLALRRALATGGASSGSSAVRLTLEDGTVYDRVGTVQFSEVTVNEATGTVTLRARIPNPDGVLMPGMFVRASFEQAVEPQAILVPQEALQRDIGGDAFVYLVGPGSKVVLRKVKTARTYRTSWVVTEGLKPGEKVITQGTANLRPGMEVKAVPADTPQRIAPRPPGEQGAGGAAGAGKAGGNGRPQRPPG